MIPLSPLFDQMGSWTGEVYNGPDDRGEEKQVFGAKRLSQIYLDNSRWNRDWLCRQILLKPKPNTAFTGSPHLCRNSPNRRLLDFTNICSLILRITIHTFGVIRGSWREKFLPDTRCDRPDCCNRRAVQFRLGWSLVPGSLGLFSGSQRSKCLAIFLQASRFFILGPF
jgi:hypothetical protein